MTALNPIKRAATVRFRIANFRISNALGEFVRIRDEPYLKVVGFQVASHAAVSIRRSLSAVSFKDQTPVK
jgi:hypothetical protein